MDKQLRARYYHWLLEEMIRVGVLTKRPGDTYEDPGGGLWHETGLDPVFEDYINGLPAEDLADLGRRCAEALHVRK